MFSYTQTHARTNARTNARTHAHAHRCMRVIRQYTETHRSFTQVRACDTCIHGNPPFLLSRAGTRQHGPICCPHPRQPPALQLTATSPARHLDRPLSPRSLAHSADLPMPATTTGTIYSRRVARLRPLPLHHPVSFRKNLRVICFREDGAVITATGSSSGKHAHVGLEASSGCRVVE